MKPDTPVSDTASNNFTIDSNADPKFNGDTDSSPDRLQTLRVQLKPDSAQRLADLCGKFNENVQQIEQRLGVKIRNRGADFNVTGEEAALRAAESVLLDLYSETASGPLSPEKVHLHLQQSNCEPASAAEDARAETDVIHTRRQLIRARGRNQKRYVHMIQNKDINFGVGPAGTGKTWLAVACAVAALEQDKVGRILLVRPAVEAGEKLGFLPGDLAQKIDPYLRPLYDALYEMLGYETVGKLIERNVIEVAPLAYMRGRTLNDSFIILDEAQNTTKAQMKMFLTRIGFGSTAVITGDLTQVDLPRDVDSGLRHAIKVLKRIDAIGVVNFESKDVVRHALVQRIVDAYDNYESADAQQQDRASRQRKS